MDLPSIKELNKIVKFCRKTGVKTFELGELRITLTDEVPTKPSKTLPDAPKAPKTSIQGEVGDDGPSPDELLFWSVGGPPEADNTLQ